MTSQFKAKKISNGVFLTLAFGLSLFLFETVIAQVPGPVPLVGTGGTVTTQGSDRVHTFTAGGTFTPPIGVSNVEVLVVGGGGGGGAPIQFGTAGGGGGGAGGLVYNPAFAVTGGSPVTVTVGAGGGPTPSNNGFWIGNNGSNSTFDSITALGGGGGSGNNEQGQPGGSGGGSRSNPGGIATQPGSASAGFGNRGGNFTNSPGGAGASGGGGAGGAGEDLPGSSGQAGDGGVGLQYSISGTPTFYAGGGGGGNANNDPLQGAGGLGGGGNGGNTGTPPIAGTPNTGGGGGGGNDAIAGAAGGSGIVIVRYTVPTLTITQQPSINATTALPFAQQPVIRLLNGAGTGVSGVNVTASIFSGTGTLSGTLTVTTDAAGLAAFTDLRIIGSGNHSIRFVAAGAVQELVSNTIDIIASPPTITLLQQPSALVTGSVDFAQQPIVELLDGTTAPLSGINITASIVSGSGTLTETLTVATNGSGQALFSGLRIDGSGNHTIRFTAAGFGVTVDSNVVNVVPPTISINTQPSASATSNIVFAQQPTVELLDNGAAPISGISITAFITSGSGILQGTTTVPTNGSGLAAFPDLAINGSGNHTIGFIAAGSGVSVDANVVNVTPPVITIIQQPSEFNAVSTLFTQQPIIELQDAGASPLAGINITASIFSGTGNLVGTVNVATNGSGQAVFTDLQIDAADTFVLRFTAAGAGVSVDSAPINVGTAAISIIQQPSSTVPSGGVFPLQPLVELLFNGSPVAGSTITATIQSGGGSLAGTTSVITDGSGLATYSDLAITGSGNHTLRFTSPVFGINTDSNILNVLAPVVGCPGFDGSSLPITYKSCTETKVPGQNISQQITLTTPPTAVVGDLMIAAIAIDESHTVNPLAGWTLINQDNAGGGGQAASFAVFYKFAVAGDLAGPGINHSFDDVPAADAGTGGATPVQAAKYGWVMNFSGVSGISDVGFTPDGGASNPAVSPPVTTTSNNNLILRLGGFDDSEIAVDTATLMAGYTRITADNSHDDGIGNANGDSVSGAAAYSVQASPGVSPAVNFTNFANTQRWVTLSLALEPLPTQFRISHGLTTNNCSAPTNVTIQATDDSGNPITTYTGTIDLSTNTGFGTWGTGTGNGSLTPPVNNGSGVTDGTASYTFDPADNGQVVLTFSSPLAGLHNFDIVDADNPGIFENSSFDPDLNIAFCPNYEFAISNSGPTDTCTPATVNFRVAQVGAGPTLFGYTGTITISNDINAGFWAPGSSSGTLVRGTGDGAASYTFDSADLSVVSLGFYSSVADPTVNFDVTDGTFSEGVDNELVITTCPTLIPSISYLQCFPDSVTGNVTIPSRAVNSNRIVLLSMNNEGNPAFPTSANFDTGAIAGPSSVPMLPIGSSYLDDGNFDMLTEVWGLLDSALPDTGGNYNVAFGGSGAGNDTTVCLITLIDAEQIIPPGLGAQLNTNPVNFTNIDTPPQNQVTTQITTQEDNALVISHAGNGGVRPWLTSTLGGAPLWSVIAGGQQTFGGFSSVIPAAGLVTVTDTAEAGGNFNRVGHVVTGFSPAPPIATQFSITHNNVGGTCAVNRVTISALRANGTIDTNYVGTLTITTTPGLGDWSDVAGANAGVNSVSNGALNDGTATYVFAPGDSGSVDLGYTLTSSNTVNFNVTDGSITETVFFDNDLFVGNCAFRISNVGNAYTCSDEAITITAVDGGGNRLTGYAGTISLSTSTGIGAWNYGGVGLTDTFGPNDGLASYTFQPGDDGEVVLQLHHSAANGAVDIFVTDGVYNQEPGFVPLNVLNICEFQISFVGPGDTCTAEPITIDIVDGDGAPGNRFAGLITLTTSNNDGTWTLNTGAGVFNDATPNDGKATYTFSATDAGQAVFDFSTLNGAPVNFNVTGGGYTVDIGADPTLTIVDCGFEISFVGGNNSDVCSLKLVEVRAVDGSGGPFSYVGTINLSTALTTGDGSWGLDTGFGTFNDPSPEDGAASYTFLGDDGGVAVFELRHSTPGLVNIDIVGGSLTENASADPDLTVADCSFRFSLSSPSINACTFAEATLEVRDSLGNPAADFEGTVNLTTSTGNGNWLTTTNGLGPLTDTNPNDGIASYTFLDGDGPSVIFEFSSETVETLNLEAEFNGSIVDSLFDPALQITQCQPTISDTQCYTTESEVSAITLPSSSETGGSRMVLMYTNVENQVASVTATISANPMTLLRTETAVNGGTTNVLQVFAILDAALPAGAGTYSAAHDGNANSAMCIVAVEGVKQSFPVQNGTTPANGQLNGTNYPPPATGNASTDITVNENNSILLSVAANGQGGTTYTSSLGTTEWIPGAADAVGADWAGFSDFQATATSLTVTQPNNATPNAETHIALALAPFFSGDPIVEGYVPVTLFKTFSGNLNYRATGNSLRALPNTSNANACTFFDPASGPGGNQTVNNTTGTTAILDLPPGSSVVDAYLYWAGSGRDADIDNAVSFGVDGSEVSFTADGIYKIENPYGFNLEYFAGYKNVTGLITTTPKEIYRFKDLEVRITEPGGGIDWLDIQGCLGGWGMIVVYENPLEDLNVINLFDGFQPFRFTSFTLTPGNFRMGSPDGVSSPNGQITHLTFEGDDSLNEPGELFQLQNSTSTLTFTPLINSENSAIANGDVDAQYNDTITYPIYDANLNFDPLTGVGGYTVASTTSYGTDVDTYYIQGAVPGSTQLEILWPFGESGAEQINTLFGTGQDGVFLVGEFISVNNAAIADLEVFISQSGSFKVGSSATATYNYTVTNNGNGTGATQPGPPFNFADGDVILTINLPIGMTAASVTENGWTCVADVPVPNATAFTCVFNIGADYTTGAVNSQLWAGESLPDVVVTVNLDDESSNPLLSNSVSQSARIAHTENYPGTCVVEAPGVQPDPTVCELPPQFDNVNDLNKNIIDVDDLDEKTANNNNVVQQTTNVLGIVTDLRMVKSVVGVLEENQPAQYLLTVTNLGPDITTKTMTITDTLPDGLVPSTAIGAAWSCNIVSQTVTCTNNIPLNVGVGYPLNITTVSVVAPAIEGAFVSNTALVQAGTFNFDQVNGNNTSTTNTQVVGEPVASNRKFLISVNELSDLGTGTGVLPGFEDGDLVLYDPQTDVATMFLAEADIPDLPGLTELNNINAVHLLPNGQILMSTDTDGSSIVGVTFNAEDVVLYDPILQTATVVFSGTGVFDSQANIDAIHVLYNNSYNPSDWDLIVSTEDDVLIAAVPYDDNDLIQFDLSPATPTATLRVDGADSEVFGADTGDIDALYIDFENEDIYTLSTDDPGAVTIGGPMDQDTYTQDDLVQLDLGTPTMSIAQNVFLGDVANGVFLPTPSATRKLDAVHVIEDGYYGHFAIISNGSGDTCTPTSITIRRHIGLSHVTDTNYAGSIRLSNDSGTGEWQADISANGMLVDSLTTDGEAIYTFDPADNGEVILFLKDTAPVLLNVDVTNFFNEEDPNEDNDILVSDVVTNVSYLDTFGSVSYNNNDGIASFADDWIEINDGLTGAASGAIKIVSNSLNLTNPGGNTFPEILREIDMSGYTPNTVTDPLTLNFDWSRTGGVGVDSFQVQARNNAPSGAWTTLTNINGITGAVAGNSVSLDLTAAGITPTATVQIKFVVNAGYQIQSFNLDNIEVTTATNDCNVGGTVDHYAISNSGFGISCLVENITIIPHTPADLTTQPGQGVTITLNTSGKGTWFPPIGGAGPFSSVEGTGSAQYTYQAGEDVLVFPYNHTGPATDPDVVNFSLVDSNVPTKTQLENQSLSVSRAGLRFYNDTAGNMTYPTLVAGMDSFLYTGDILTVQAIQASNNNPAVCEDIFAAGTDVQIELAFECADPAVCSATTIPVEVTNNSNTTVIEPTDNNSGAGPNPGGYNPITLRFETFNNGDFDQDPGPGTDFSYIGARINLNYADAGSLQIHGRYNIPFLDGAGAQSGNYMQGSGDNNFVIRPFGYDIDVIVDTGSGPQADRRLGGGNDTDAYSWADDAIDNGAFVAGEGFNTIVTAIAWDAADDDGDNGGVANDGIPDPGSDLFDNDPTPNYGNEFDPTQNNMTIVQSLNAVMPVGAVTGTLTNTAYTDFNANNGSQTNALVWDEVGIIDLTATLDSGSYLGSGEGVTGDLFNLGRFIPANFTVTMTNLVDRPLFTPSASAFTYMGEDFTAEFTLTAINALGSPTTTRNYIGDFARLDTPGELSFFAIQDLTGAGDDIDYSARLQTSVSNGFPADFSADWVAGAVPLSGNLIFNRQDAPSQVDYDLGLRQEEAPITSLQIAVTAIDEDSVIDTGRNVDDDDGSVETDTFLYNLIGIQEFRYGRIRLENAYGSEIPEEQETDGEDQNITGEDIPIYIIAEYFDGTDFVPNTDDVATPYSSANLSLVPGSFTDNLNVTNASSTITVGNGVIFQGETGEQNVNDRPLFLQAPGEGNDGTMLIELDLDALGLGFLKHEWRGAGQIEDDLQDSSFDDNPRALIEFGVLQSDERIINWQELFLE